MLVKLLAFLGTLGSTACMIVLIDEPECPESLIK
ncbi:MAG: cyclic lactone autoinducer peptide [Bacilli bacterium]|nr:cyclic lactone autoinducer peptide [Bacilli bacterium]MDD4733772.1 cyclic lactone autoinducer peptide [Bacilli bacterium]